MIRYVNGLAMMQNLILRYEDNLIKLICCQFFQIYRTERFGDFTYNIPVPIAEFSVDLHIAEIVSTLLYMFDRSPPTGSKKTLHMSNLLVILLSTTMQLDQGNLTSLWKGLRKQTLILT
jgi:hypothetical protein